VRARARAGELGGPDGEASPEWSVEQRQRAAWRWQLGAAGAHESVQSPPTREALARVVILHLTGPSWLARVPGRSAAPITLAAGKLSTFEASVGGPGQNGGSICTTNGCPGAGRRSIRWRLAAYSTYSCLSPNSAVPPSSLVFQHPCLPALPHSLHRNV